jgi:hypothetical protein
MDGQLTTRQNMLILFPIFQLHRSYNHVCKFLLFYFVDPLLFLWLLPANGFFSLDIIRLILQNSLFNNNQKFDGIISLSMYMGKGGGFFAFPKKQREEKRSVGIVKQTD